MNKFKLLSLSLITTGMANMASAQENIGAVATTIQEQLEDVGKLIMGGAFIAGIGFVGVGLMRLKAAVDSQGQQTKYSEGLWRIGLGSALVALPAVVGVGIGTFGFDQTQNLTMTTLGGAP